MPNTTTYLRSVQTGSSPDAPALLRRVRALTAGYLAISLAAIAALVLHAGGGASAWVHAVVVGATALGSFSASILASRGQRGAFIRLRVFSVVLVVAVAVIVALPGSFPLWIAATS